MRKIPLAVLGAAVAGALTLTALPAATASAAPAPASAWGKQSPRFEVPPVKTGTNKPAAAQPEKEPTAEAAAWRRAQKQHATTSSTTAPRQSAAAINTYVPKGQGAVPWHQISDFRITDSLVGRVDYSTGNLMLAATDFEVAGVGQKLRLSRTYNSLDAPWGRVTQRWWQEYERYLDLDFTNEVILYDATGATLTFTKNSDGSLSTPAGYSKDLKKNSDGTYTLTDRKTGTKDTYNSYGSLTKVTDKNNGTITVTPHDEGGEQKGFKLTETRSGRWIDLLKTDASQWQAKDLTGRTAVFDLDPAGNLTRTADTEGKTTTFGYDSSGRITKVTTPEGRVTVFTYDSQSRLTSMLRATGFNGTGESGPTYTYAYSADTPTAAGTTTVTDPERHTTKYEHDGDGAVTKVTDALNHSRSRTYDARHNLATATDAMGTGGTGANITTYGWDSRNNPTSAKLPTGATASATGYQTIAGTDLPGTVTNADDEKTDYKYDAVGNTLSVAQTGTGGGARTFDYNPSTPTCGGFEGQTCKTTTKMTDSHSVATAFHYDSKGNLDKATPPAPLGTTTYTYDTLGRTETVTDGRGIKTVYVYDHRDRVIKVSTTHATVTYAYDGDGNLTQRSDGTGVTRYAFDPLSRETVRTLQDGSQTRLTYTPAGNVETYSDPAGVTAYAYNEVNKLRELKDPTGKTTTYAYDNNDFRTKTNYPGGTVQSINPDKSGRPQTIKATSSKGTLVDLAYSYQNGTKDSTKIRTTTDAEAKRQTTYSYDGAGRLTFTRDVDTSGVPSIDVVWAYCYDRAGNVTSEGNVFNQTCPSRTTYTYNDAQQLTAKNDSTTNWSYDATGNETAGAPTPETTRTGETWSDFSQLTSLTTGNKTYTGQYASTDQSERIRLGDTYFHNGPLGLSGTSLGGMDTGFNREPQGTLNSMTTGTSSLYYLTDALGSVIALVDDTGTKVNSYTYTPRGASRTTTEKTPQPYRFAAGYQDPTGLYHLGARYYDPNLGRFTQPDPSGQEKNPYLYAEGDPANRIDPQGLISLSGVADALGPIGDLIQGGYHLLNGDANGLWGDVAGLAAGAAVGLGCEYVMTSAAAPTLGASAAAGQPICYAAAWGASTAVSNLIGG
ncbi:RHS repeat-associated core domain-containing protein [Streptomyces crystallinus]|uniref:RHS repeat-associated core domain-containing protein n=1 Tax=Streptomyces crystallinus TaxID=68191 RepID=UPI0031D3E997